MKTTPIVLTFTKRPLLVNGVIGFTESKFHIFIAEDMDERETVVTAWHEIIHFLMIAGNHPLQSGDINILEPVVEAYAERLANAFPEILEIVGLKP